jgi:RNase P/RNase MRP subunit p30
MGKNQTKNLLREKKVGVGIIFGGGAQEKYDFQA